MLGIKMNKNILIIDDDTKLNKLLTEFLVKFNFDVRAVTEPEEGFRELAKSLPDIIILDVMLPGMDGFEVCRRIRGEYTVPIIMLTARGDVADRIVGLELGADDYMPKPFEPRELVARIQSVLRRSSSDGDRARARFGELEIDYRKHTVSVGGVPVDLTSMEFEILSLFTRNPGTVLDRDAIFEQVKGLDDESFDRSIDVMVSRLRSKLGDDPKKPTYIKTMWGKGYKFIGEPGLD
jgi:DNA-binding response OmpR family regulator